MIYDIRVTLTRDGTWRTSVDGQPAVEVAETAPEAVRMTADWMMRGGRQVPERRVSTTVYLDPAHLRALRALSDERRVPQAVLIREALDLFLSKNTRPMPEASPGLGHAPSDVPPEEAPAPRSSPAGSGASSDPPSPFRPGGRRLLSAVDDESPLAPPRLPPPPTWVCRICGHPEPRDEDAPGHLSFEPCPEDR